MDASRSRYASRVEMVQIEGLRVSTRSAGDGETILLLHGFPHTKEVWREVEPVLVSAGYRVVTPDLRGTGDTERPACGYDALGLAMDQVRLLDEFSIPSAHVVGFDIGAAPAFAMAASHPDRVRTLTIIEAVIGGLPGAEAFLGSGAPWWFGLHQAPGGLAEDLITGREARYIQFFLDIGSCRGVPDDLAAHFVKAYTGHDRLRAAFDHYRAMPTNAASNKSWAERNRLTMPVTAIGGATVRDAPARQLAALSDSFTEYLLPEAGHIVPIDAPDILAEMLLATAGRTQAP